MILIRWLHQKTGEARGSNGQKYFNIALVLQDEWLTIFTRPANTCTCPLKVYAIKNIREFYVIRLPRVTLPKVLVLQDECFGKNYSSFIDFTHNYKRKSGIFVPWALDLHCFLKTIYPELRFNCSCISISGCMWVQYQHCISTVLSKKGVVSLFIMYTAWWLKR